MKDEITKEYSRLKESDFPSYYVTNITVSFNDIKEEEVINSIDVDIKGNKKTVDIGNVRLIKLAEEFDVGEYALEAGSIFSAWLIYSQIRTEPSNHLDLSIMPKMM